MTSTSPETPEDPRTLAQAIRYFSDPDLAFEFVKKVRWPSGRVSCPRCGHDEVTFVKTRRIWRCKNRPECGKQFSAKVGTIFEDSPLGWDVWLPAVWLIANSKNSVSSHELARALGITQKTAWFVFHRIRLAMETGSFQKVSGTVEVDEHYVGGRAVNMHKWQREERFGGRRGQVEKTPVQGALHRETGTVQAAVFSGRDLRANVKAWVEPGSTVYTDEAKGYRLLHQDYAHEHVTHGREYVRGNVHTNGIESFWALFERAVKGTHVHIDPDHTHRYVAERVFAYNNRNASDLERMRLAVGGVAGRRLTYSDLIAKKG